MDMDGRRVDKVLVRTLPKPSAAETAETKEKP
jgi:hypothetical protein